MKQMSLTRFELYKLFSRKHIWIILGFLIIVIYLPLQIINIPSGPQPFFQATPPTSQQVQLAKKNQAQVKAKLHSLSQSLAKSHSGPNKEYWRLIFQQQKDQAILSADSGGINRKNLSALRFLMSKDVKTHGKSSFAYQRDRLQYDMIEALPFVGSGQYLGVGMQIATFFSVFGSVFMGALVLIGLSPMFSSEYGIGMDSFLLTSKRGKRELATAKLQASIIYVAVMEGILAIVNLTSNIVMYGTKGIHYPIQSLQYATPLHVSIVQYFAVASFMQLVGGVALGVLVLLISTLNRSPLASFVISGSILVLPLIVAKALSTPWAPALRHFSYVSLLQVGVLFKAFRVANVFGYPVLYPFAVTTVIILISIPVTWFIFWGYRRHQVV